MTRKSKDPSDEPSGDSGATGMYENPEESDETVLLVSPPNTAATGVPDGDTTHQYTPDEKGLVKANVRHVPQLLEHGFKPHQA